MKRNLILFAGAASVGLAACAHAQTPPSASFPVNAAQYVVTINTSSLDPTVTYTLEYQLSDGRLTGDGNTQIAVRSLNFDGGAASKPTATGGAVVAANGDVTLSDTTSNFPNADYTQSFQVPASATKFVSYAINLLQNGTDGNTPDQFVFNLLNGSASALPTADPFDTALLTINYPSSNSKFQYTNYNTNLVSIAAAPEPGGFVDLAVCIGGLGVLLARRRRAA